MAECWDSDPDLDFDDSAFALSAPSESSTEDHQAASLKKRGSSAGLEDNDDEDDWGADFDGEGIERWKENATPASGGANEERDPFERTAESDASQPRTKEEEDQSSTSSSRSGTLKGLLSSFSGLSLDSPSNELGSPSFPRSDSTSTFSSSSSSTTAGVNSHDDHTQTLPATPRPSSRRDSSPQRTPGPTSTLRHSSQLSSLLASATAGPGRVHHLGSTPQGAAKSVLGDWDEDLELDGLDARGLPLERGKELRAKASFASHISDDLEGDAFLEGSRGLPTPRSSRKGTIKPSAPNSTAPAPLRGKASTSDFTDDDGDFEAESDFELPDDIAQITLSPLLARASNSSLNSHSRNSSQALQLPTTLTTPSHLPLPLPAPTLLARAPSRHSTASPGLSMGGTTTDDEDEDDEAFFEEIVLPPYFLGGPGAMTPPSDGEGFGGGRIDLQGMLKRKLAARGGKVEEKGVMGDGKLEGYREKEDEEDEGGEAGLVIEVGVKLGAERMRTRSGPKPPALKGRRTSGSNIRALTSTRPSSRPPPLPRSSSSTTAPRAVNPLSRSGSSTSLSTLPTNNSRTPHSSNSSQPSPGRPSSAAGLVERLPRPERRGPPPAPSTAARDRVRTRTASLRTTASNGDLRGAAAAMSTPSGARRPPRLDMSKDPPQASSTVLSPVPMTPSTPSASTRPPTLRSRRSQGNLLATPSTTGGGRTMERKRSLQSLPKLELTQGTPVASTSTSTASRRPLRSPTPSTPSSASTSFFSPSSSPTLGRTTTPSTTSRFAAPTASSISRVRERVSSNPVLPPSPLTSTTTSFSHLAHPPRPSSAASGRLLQPTASSAAKASPRLPSSGSFSNSPIAGLRIPSAALRLAKPKKQRAYGDGTELDGFDDLPLTKGERERERTVSQSMRRSSAGTPARGAGAGGTVKPSAAERRGQNPSSGSTGSGGSRESGGTLKVKPSASSRSTSTGGSTIKASSRLAPPSLAAGSKRPKAESAEEGVEKKSKTMGEKDKTRRKKEPQLIRNLGAPGMAKAVGEMTWNPLLHRWEGNESVLRDFDKALSSSTRPALITQLSSGLSPARVGFPSLSKTIVTSPSESASTSAGDDTSATSLTTSLLGLTPASHPLRHGSTSSTLSAPNVKLVGSMVFDPIRMSWHSIAPEGEDELDLAFEGGDWADDEGDGAGSGRAPSALSGVMGDDGDEDGWAMGEKERMLKNRASFVMSESGDGESEADGPEGEARRRLRESCEEGERKCREEFERWGWMRTEGEGEEEEMRNHLWNIRELIMDNRSPPRR